MYRYLIIFLLFVMGCHSGNKKNNLIGVLEKSSSMSKLFKAGNSNQRIEFEDFEENHYQKAIQSMIDSYEKEESCMGCLNAYLKTIQYFTSSASEAHAQQLSYFINKKPYEVESICRTLTNEEREGVRFFIETSYQMKLASVSRDAIKSCL